MKSLIFTHSNWYYSFLTLAYYGVIPLTPTCRFKNAFFWHQNWKLLIISKELHVGFFNQCLAYMSQIENKPQAIHDFFPQERAYVPANVMLCNRVILAYFVNQITEVSCIETSDVHLFNYNTLERKVFSLMSEHP